MGSGDGGAAGGLPMAPPAEAWQLAAAAAAPQLEELKRSLGQPPPLHVLRSSQADALRLDAELGGILQEQLARLFEHFSPGTAAHLEPELRAVLSLLVFGLSVWCGRATPGSELLNLRYRDEWAVAARPELVGPSGVGGPGLSLPQRVALGLGTAVLPYAWSRLCRAAHEGDWAEAEAPGGSRGGWWWWRWRAAAAVGMRWCEAAVTLAAAVNSWAFLARGDYRSLLERLVGARLVWRQAAMSRVISFEYLNRQLVWQELSEALLLMMPLMDMNRWIRRAAIRALPRPAAVATAAAAGGGVQPCPLCGAEEPLTAVVALPCRHVFCYYCLAANTQADPGFRCPADGVRVAAMRRRRGGGRGSGRRGGGQQQGPGVAGAGAGGGEEAGAGV
ncbi:hypothetical protein PLESTB_000369600 [Pleodorina starrii]|uniref:RING-type E3 ubiquitin transferase (cysteine targeting) n=1 Tax=Pleodorina starrii TaxID=330485 RepID=A0A9W6BDU8_9CHLO|nr:hypothetical protein PLESTM_000025300 [Pleodorina starrii]GLC50351.1 hypothetical protein PLESTB_000369600 [Pleodorina starrii]GLC64267.1 hypothetical protein PLESTF_000143100 [Pleodorina starrii]